MGSFVSVAKNGELAEKTMQKFTVQGREILVAKIGDTCYAVDNRCTHLGADLSKGKLEGTVVTCPLHGSQFDLRDGRVIRWTNWPRLIAAAGKVIKPARPLQTYNVKVEGDDILIET
ncbi:Rieske (2Fe-2S) protein [Chloroflexota bacterium]